MIILFFLLELLYFQIADRFNIIDKPNQRSSHTQITLRGGGIIFYFAALAYFIFHPQAYYFFIGLTLIALISFIDDILTIPSSIRITIHLLSICLLSHQLGLFHYSWWILLPSIIVMIGIINAYNFMDGINGITACYSLAVLALLFWVNNEVHFIDADFILYCIMAVAVFAFFNFRKKAKCFAGDVGSVSIAFIILFLLGLLMVKTGNVIYVLFLLVYGLDAIWTIVRRLMRKENIFEAHRTHLYQLMANEMGMNRLLISLSYGLLQLVIGCGIIFLSKQSLATQVVVSLSVILGFSLVYLVVKKNILQKHLS